MSSSLAFESSAPAGYRFADYFFCLRSLRLEQAGETVRLQPQPARLLALLLSRANQVVSRDDIRDAIWGPDQFLDTEQAINFAVRKVRVALGESAGRPRYLETVPKAGYRFKVPALPVYETPDPTDKPISDARTATALDTWATPSPGLDEEKASSPASESRIEPEPEAGGPTVPARAHRRPSTLLVAVFAGSILAIGLFFGLSPRAEPNSDSLTAIAAPSPETAAPEKPVRLAVLSMATVDQDGALADVISEEIMTVLASRTVEGLSILSMRSIRSLQQDLTDPREIAERLDADFLLHGSLSRVDQGIRLSLRLTRPDGQGHLWAGMKTARLDALPEWYGEVTSRILEKMSLPSGRQQETSTILGPELYELYFQGRYLIGRSSREEIAEGTRKLETVVESAPDFAPALVYLAKALLVPGEPRPFHLGMPRVEELAERALRLDPEQASAHRLKATVRFFLHHDWAGGLASAERAVELRPNDPQNLQTLAMIQAAHGHHDEAAMLLRRAIDVDPETLWVQSDLAYCLFYAERFDEASEVAELILSVEPLHYMALQIRNSILLLERSPESYASICEMYRGYGLECPPDLDAMFRDDLEALEGHSRQGYRSRFQIALNLAQAGQPDRSLDALREACSNEPDWELPFAAIDPRFEEVRKLPGFAELRSCFPPRSAD